MLIIRFANYDSHFCTVSINTITLYHCITMLTGNPIGKTVQKLIENSIDVTGIGGSVAAATGNASSGKCHYDCLESGACTVRLTSSKQATSGNTMGSCFSELFGGRCIGIPPQCVTCSKKCVGRKKQKFTENTTIWVNSKELEENLSSCCGVFLVRGFGCTYESTGWVHVVFVLRSRRFLKAEEKKLPRYWFIIT